jgi:hypothetical protein
MKKALNKKNYILIIKLTETVSNLYKSEDKSICLNPYTLFENKEIKSNEDLNRIIQHLKKQIENIKNKDVKILNRLETDLGVYHMPDLKKKITEHNTSVIFPPKKRLIRKKNMLYFLWDIIHLILVI